MSKTVQKKLDELRDKITENKKKKLDEALLNNLAHIPFDLVLALKEKIDSIELGANVNEPIELVYAKLRELGIDADTIQGIDPVFFAKKTHQHNDILASIKELNGSDKSLDYKIGSIVKEIEKLILQRKKEDEDKDKSLNIKLKNIKESLEKEKLEFKEIFENLKKDLKGKENVIGEDDLDMKGKQIKNLGEPKDKKDATTKDYVDNMAQRAKGGSGGGSGISYALPVASAGILGGIKIGARLTMTGDVLSADVQGGAGVVWNEEYPASGVVDGVNKVFVFTHTPAFISLDGQALSTLASDYSVLVKTVTLLNAPINTPPVNKYLS